PWPILLDHYIPGKKFCEACGTGIYSRATCTKSVYSYQPDLFQDCGGAST
ncbi:putative zinc ribbon protein, partial [Escherichia coli]